MDKEFTIVVFLGHSIFGSEVAHVQSSAGDDVWDSGLQGCFYAIGSGVHDAATLVVAELGGGDVADGVETAFVD